MCTYVLHRWHNGDRNGAARDYRRAIGYGSDAAASQAGDALLGGGGSLPAGAVAGIAIASVVCAACCALVDGPRKASTALPRPYHPGNITRL